jgi:hypothetical protein
MSWYWKSVKNCFSVKGKMTDLLLNDKQIKQTIIEADKRMWEHKPHPRWEGEKYLINTEALHLAQKIKERLERSKENIFKYKGAWDNVWAEIEKEIKDALL